MTINRRNYGSGHAYKIDGLDKPGVTKILREALSKDALIQWAGDATARFDVDHREELIKLGPIEHYERSRKARYEERDAAGKRGTEVHRLGAELVAGHEVPVPEEIAGHVESYVDFLDRMEPEPILVETVVGHRRVGYCGTLDLVADLEIAGRRLRWLLDLKTSRSGIFYETALQCCAYARAEVYLEEGRSGAELSMAELGIDRLGAIHITANGWELRELESGEEVWEFFRHLAWIQRRLEDARRSWVGPAIEPPLHPTTNQGRFLEEEDGGEEEAS